MNKKTKQWMEHFEMYKKIIEHHTTMYDTTKIDEKLLNRAPPRGFVQNNMDWGMWASNQRMQRKRGLLSQDKIDKLEAIGFQWNVFKRRKINESTNQNNNNNEKSNRENNDAKNKDDTKEDKVEQKLTSICTISDDIFIQGMLCELRKRFNAIAFHIERKTCVHILNEIKIDTKNNRNNDVIFLFIEGLMNLLYQTKKENEEYTRAHENGDFDNENDDDEKSIPSEPES